MTAIPPTGRPELQEEKPNVSTPTADEERAAIAAALANPESTPSPTPSPGGVSAESFANIGRIEADRKAALDALERTEYGKMARKSGQPLFSAGELRLIAKDPEKLGESERAKRDNLIKRASAWRAERREQLERVYKEQLAEAARVKATEIQAQAIQTVTGREVYETWNGAIELLQLAGMASDKWSHLSFKPGQVEKLKDDTALILLKYPQIRKWLLLEIPEARLAIGLAIVVGGNAKAFIQAAREEREEAAKKKPPAGQAA